MDGAMTPSPLVLDKHTDKARLESKSLLAKKAVGEEVVLIKRKEQYQFSLVEKGHLQFT